MTAQEARDKTKAWMDGQYERVIQAIQDDGQQGDYSCIRYEERDRLRYEVIEKLIEAGYEVREDRNTYNSYFICWRPSAPTIEDKQARAAEHARTTYWYEMGYEDGLIARPFFIRLLAKLFS